MVKYGRVRILKKSVGIIIAVLLMFNQIAFGALDIFKDIDINTNVDNSNGSIHIMTKDSKSIEFNEYIKNNPNVISDYINLITTQATYQDVSSEVYGYTNQSIKDFNVNISSDNKGLILSSKSGKLSNFANYTISIYNDIVAILGSSPKDYNRVDSAFETRTFTNQRDIVEAIYPANNSTNIEKNPLIAIKFKYPVQINDISKISLKYSDGKVINLDNDDIYISADGKYMRVNLDKLMKPEQNKFPLRDNSVTIFKIERGGLSCKDLQSVSKAKLEYNKDVELKFTTGTTTKKCLYRPKFITTDSSDIVINQVYTEPEVKICGYDLAENLAKTPNVTISKIRMVNINNNNTINILPQDITKKPATNDNSIKFKIRGTNAKELSKEANAGSYNIFVDYSDSSTAQTNISTLNLLLAKPYILNTSPYKNEVVSENTNSIRVTYLDVDEKMSLISKVTPKASVAMRVYSEGSLDNLVDTEKDITLRKNKNEFIIDLPLKGGLVQNTKYKAYINPNIVQYENVPNEEYSWDFTTQINPIPINSNVLSLPEEYFRDEKLIVQGDFFESSAQVYFSDNNKETRAYNVKWIDSKNLEVIPPYNNRLETGTYDIIVYNNSTHKGKLNCGKLSIVPSAKFKLSNDYRYEDTSRDSKIQQNLKISENTILINSASNFSSLDFDKLLGEDTLVRKIKFERGTNAYGNISVKSKRGEALISNIAYTGYSNDDSMVITVGGIDNNISDKALSKLKNLTPISELFAVSGDNFKASSINVKLPFKNSDGSNIRVLRYDEGLRNWFEVGYTVDRINKVVNLISPKSGIFVVAR